MRRNYASFLAMAAFLAAAIPSPGMSQNSGAPVVKEFTNAGKIPQISREIKLRAGNNGRYGHQDTPKNNQRQKRKLWRQVPQTKRKMKP